MKKITVVSLGPGSRDYLTLGALSCIKSAKKLILRTDHCDAARYLVEQGIGYESLDFLHEECEDFDELNERAAKHILAAAKKTDVVYAVFDARTDETVAQLKTLADVNLLCGVPASEPFLCAAGESDVRICPAYSVPPLSGNEKLLLTELDSKLLAGDVKLRIIDLYGDEADVLFFDPVKDGEARVPRTIVLCDLDRQKHYDHTCAALVKPKPLTQKERYTFMDLVHIMRILRGENGCDWDREQTHISLRQYLIEEAYETCAAIDEEDWPHAADELGDVLLQVVFQADIGQTCGTMSLSDITTAICQKMIRRHPHIFGDPNTPHDWETIKKQERGETDDDSALSGISSALPALIRAEKVKKKASAAGFDYKDALEAVQVVHEEAEEVRQALTGQGNIEEEIGDLLFACVNIARLSGIESETALLKASEKFEKRFRMMEKLIKLDGKSLKGLTADDFRVYWNCSKHRLDTGVD